MSASDIISVLGTEPEQLTVSGIMILLIFFETVTIVALWRDRTRRENDLDALVKQFAEVAEKYDKLATTVSRRFDELVGRMASKFFGEGK